MFNKVIFVPSSCVWRDERRREVISRWKMNFNELEKKLEKKVREMEDRKKGAVVLTNMELERTKILSCHVNVSVYLSVVWYKLKWIEIQNASLASFLSWLKFIQSKPKHEWSILVYKFNHYCSHVVGKFFCSISVIGKRRLETSFEWKSSFKVITHSV